MRRPQHKQLSDWRGARVSKAYKDNYDRIFRKKEEERKEPKYEATIKGTNQRYKLERTCPVCKGYLVYTGVGRRTCERCGYRQ